MILRMVGTKEAFRGGNGVQSKFQAGLGKCQRRYERHQEAAQWVKQLVWRIQ